MAPLPFHIPAHWTDEEALVVFEFIDDIREQIWGHYRLQIQSVAKLTQVNIGTGDLEQSNEQIDFIDDDVPF